MNQQSKKGCKWKKLLCVVLVLKQFEITAESIYNRLKEWIRILLDECSSLAMTHSTTREEFSHIKKRFNEDMKFISDAIDELKYIFKTLEELRKEFIKKKKYEEKHE